MQMKNDPKNTASITEGIIRGKSAGLFRHYRLTKLINRAELYLLKWRLKGETPQKTTERSFTMNLENYITEEECTQLLYVSESRYDDQIFFKCLKIGWSDTKRSMLYCTLNNGNKGLKS